MPVKFEKFDSELMESLCAELLTPKENERKQVFSEGGYALLIDGYPAWIEQLKSHLKDHLEAIDVHKKAILLSEIALALGARLISEKGK